MNEMWNKRYAQEEYVYGKEPNEFFKQELEQLSPGNILLPAEGEGRNAVFAAQLGWKVNAFDSSYEAFRKAQKLAQEKKVRIHYFIDAFEEVLLPEDIFDLIGLFYVHTQNRRNNHQQIISYLKPNGILLLEAFTKKQINNNTGGPQKKEMLFSVEELKEDFSSLSELKIWEEERFLNEGEDHAGIANIVRVIGRK